MIVGYHVILGAYGFWLPNDPRGSWSDFVGSWDLFRYGAATKTEETCSLAYREHDHAERLAAKALIRPPVQFAGIQARAIGRGFANYVGKSGLPIWACAILPDHVHLVVGPVKGKIEQTVIQLKGAATKNLCEEAIHPFQREEGVRPPKCFSRGEWKVFLDPPDVLRSIRYVEENPLKEGKPPQKWPFVTTPLG